MAHAREKRFDVVVCWSLDRFGGSVLECIRCIQELYNIGIRWVAIHQNLDTGAGTPMARCAMHVLAAVGESQRELNQEKRRAGQRRYQQDLQAGLVGETAHSRSGLDLPPYRPKTILDRERDKVQELRSQDQSIRQIARSVGIGVGTVIRILQEPTESKKD
jgi:DNA invertase Pin-like site-specific DNA recombinase